MPRLILMPPKVIVERKKLQGSPRLFAVPPAFRQMDLFVCPRKAAATVIPLPATVLRTA